MSPPSPHARAVFDRPRPLPIFRGSATISGSPAIRLFLGRRPLDSGSPRPCLGDSLFADRMATQEIRSETVPRERPGRRPGLSAADRAVVADLPDSLLIASEALVAKEAVQAQAAQKAPGEGSRVSVRPMARRIDVGEAVRARVGSDGGWCAFWVIALPYRPQR